MKGALTPDELNRLEEFLRPRWIAVVATIGRSGMPQLTPNWYRFANGRLTLSTQKHLVKYRNLMRDGRIVVCVCSEPHAEDYATVWGRAEISDDESIWPETRAIIERYMAPHQIEGRMRQLRKQNRVIISVLPQRVVFRT